jgi:hypothetical protein
VPHSMYLEDIEPHSCVLSSTILKDRWSCLQCLIIVDVLMKNLLRSHSDEAMVSSKNLNRVLKKAEGGSEKTSSLSSRRISGDT